MMGSQKLRSPEPLRGRGAPVAALLMALAGSCGGGTAATDGASAARRDAPASNQTAAAVVAMSRYHGCNMFPSVRVYRGVRGTFRPVVKIDASNPLSALYRSY